MRMGQDGRPTLLNAEKVAAQPVTVGRVYQQIGERLSFCDPERLTANGRDEL